MRKTFLLLVGGALLSFAACQNKKAEPAQPLTNDTTLVETQDAERDSTIYGKSDEFGMSTFTLIVPASDTQKADTLFLSRTAEDGTDGKIFGSLVEGGNYALTTRDNNEAIGVLINSDELDHLMPEEFSLRNGNIITKAGEKLTILELSKEKLVVKNAKGETKEYK